MPAALRWFLNLLPANPIAVRLVQNGSRRMRHLYIRSIYLAVLIVVLLWLLLAVGAGNLDYRQLAAQGARSFTWVAYLQIGLICVLAPVFMAGAIAQEANPKTWDIILTTPLSAAQIVLGNLFGRLFFILALLFASLPLFAITQYFGGVPGRSIFASYVVAACAALLVGAIAIALSVSRLAGRRAVFAFYISVVSYLAVTAGVSVGLDTVGMGMGPAGNGVTYMTSINPFLALHALLNPTTYPSAPPGTFSGIKAHMLEHPVRTWCAGSAILSVILMVASSITVRAGGIHTLGQGRASIPWYRRIFKLGAKGSDFRPPRTVWTNPIAWREAAARNSTFGRIVARWTFVIAGLAFGVILVLAYNAGSISLAAFRLSLVTTVLAEVAVTALVAINMSATSVAREREDGTLDLLLTTPITPRAYLLGKLRGLIAYLLPLLLVPVATMLVAGLYVITNGLGRNNVTITDIPASLTDKITRPIVLPEAGLILLASALPFLAFCVMVGMYFSLKSKGTIGSVVSTVALVAIVGGFFGLCGWNAASQIPTVGPVLTVLNPASAVYSLVYAAESMTATVGQSGDLASARIGLVVGAGASAALYAAVVYALLTHMVKNFDFTVRKLAGTR